MVTFHIRKTISNNDLLIQNADTHAYLFQRFSVSVDDCFLERCARSGRDGVENIRVQCLSVLVECLLRHENVQPLLGFCQPDTVYLEHSVKGDGRVGFVFAPASAMWSIVTSMLEKSMFQIPPCHTS